MNWRRTAFVWKKIVLFSSFVVSMTLGQASFAQGMPNVSDFENIFIFGDSLSDQRRMGAEYRLPNCPSPASGYWNNRFSNGFNWVDYFSRDNSVGGRVRNYAIGGAALLQTEHFFIPPVRNQVESAKNNHSNFGNSLFVVFAGANDVVGKVRNGGYNNKLASNFGDELSAELESIAANIERKGGARANIFIVGLPGLNRTPLAKEWNDAQRNWVSNVAARVDTKMFNGAYAMNFVSIRSHIANIVAGLQIYDGIWNAADSCSTEQMCKFSGGTQTVSRYNEKACGGYMFFDKLHPTSIAHCGMSAWIQQKMANRMVLPAYPTGSNLTERVRRCDTKLEIPDATWTVQGPTSTTTHSSTKQPIFYRIQGNSEAACTTGCASRSSAGVYTGVINRHTYPDGISRSMCICAVNN